MVELLTALGGVKTGLDLVKAAREMLKKDKPDIAAIAGHLSEVQDALFTAREGLGDAQEEIRNLNHQIEELKRFADIGDKLAQLLIADRCFLVLRHPQIQISDGPQAFAFFVSQSNTSHFPGGSGLEGALTHCTVRRAAQDIHIWRRRGPLRQLTANRIDNDPGQVVGRVVRIRTHLVQTLK